MSEHTPCPRGQEQALAAIQTQADIIMAKVEGVYNLDGTAIHDMRVASRRLRMALDIYEPLLAPKPRKALRKLARSITRDLGTRRELDVMVRMMREHREETHGVWQRFMDHAITIIDKRREEQANYCREAAKLAAGARFSEALAAVLAEIKTDGICILDLARAGIFGALTEARLARKEWRRSDDPESLHLVRIALKHLRYACEFHVPLYGDAMITHIEHVKAAQEILGEWNECRLLEDMVLALGGAVDYSLAQGAPLVAEAYGNHATELAEQFGPIGKALLGKEARKAFESVITAPQVFCCKSTIGENAP